jgi:hypothetical protein
MRESRIPVRTRLVIALLVVVGAVATGAAVGAHLNDSAPVTGDVTLESNNGLETTLSGTTQVRFQNAFPADDTVQLTTESGNVTVSASGPANATLATTELTGTWTNVTAIDATSNDVTVNPEDKPPVTAGGDIDTLNFTAVEADDGSPDFVYGGASGTSVVTVTGVPSNTVIGAIDASTGQLIDTATSDGSGTVTFDQLDNSEHTVELKSGDSSPALSNPQPEGPQSTTPSQVSIDVDDGDFPSDDVTVEFELDGTVVGSETLTGAGTASASISDPGAGEHTVTATAEDAYGNTNSRTWTFGTPDNLTVRNASAPWALINDRAVNVTLYQGDDVIQRSTNDANISLSGLDTDQQIVVEASAPGYNDSFVVINDITQQSTVYMLSENVSKVEVRFTLNDLTGGTFENNNASLAIQKPINRTGTPQWKTVHADEFGVAGVTTKLEQNQRYRLIVKNDIGDRRMLGSYTADVAETRELTINPLQDGLTEPDADFTYNASYLNTTSGNYVQFVYNDSTSSTDSLTVQIHERGNDSNVLLSNTTFGGPLGTVGVTEPIPADQQGTDWVVEAWIDQGGTTTHLVIPVGPQQPFLGGIPWYMQLILSIGTLWLVAGLFSQVNGDVGAIVVAGMGAIFWFMDLLPEGTGFGVVVLALLTAAIIFINERRGGGL